MTLATARNRAREAVVATMPAGALRVPPRMLDTARPDDMIGLSQQLGEADTDPVGDIGPAVVGLMVQGRAAPSHAITITAYTVVRGKLDVFTGRGLGVVDLVETALRTLPGSNLPPLLVDSAVAPLPPAIKDGSISVIRTSVSWPTAIAPGVAAGPSGMGAIRDHMAGAIADALGLAAGDDDLLRRGETEGRMRDAAWRGLLPRGGVDLEPGELFLAPATWNATDGSQWHAERASYQPVQVAVSLWDNDYDSADAHAVSLAGDLAGGEVIWPGTFNAVVRDGQGVADAVLDIGTYGCEIRLLGITPAVWDSDAGAALAKVLVEVQLMEPLQRATMRVRPVTLEKTHELVGL